MINKRVFKIAFKLFVGVSVFFSVLELCARIDDSIRYGAPIWGEYSSERLMKVDHDGIPSNVPNEKFEKWVNNSHGFRSTEFSIKKKPGTIRIVCLGASESYGLYENPGKEWPNQLQKMLPENEYQVINASVVGLGLQNYINYSNKHIVSLEPDVVILFINPLMYVTSLNKQEIGNNILSASPNNQIQKINSIVNDFRKNIRIATKIKQFLKQSIGAEFPIILKKYQIWNINKQLQRIERDRLNRGTPVDDVPDYYKIIFSEELEDILSYFFQKGCRVILTSYPTFISPANNDKYPEIILDHRRFCVQLSQNGMNNTIVQFNSVIAKVADKRKVSFVDCAGIIPKTTDYFGDAVHYTDLGAKLIAKSIADCIIGLDTN